jgi:hypothetical protein
LGVTLMLLGTNFIVNPVKAKPPVVVPPAAVISASKPSN